MTTWTVQTISSSTWTTVPVTVSNQASPLIFKNGSTSNFAIFGFAAALQSWNLDFNNEVIYRELVGGTKEVLITDRRPSGTSNKVHRFKMLYYKPRTPRSSP